MKSKKEIDCAFFLFIVIIILIVRLKESLMKYFLSIVLTALGISQVNAAELNVYSYRTPALLQPFLDAYTAETGTTFNIVHAPKGLAQRLQAEGKSSPADLVLTVDVSRVSELKDLDLLAPIASSVINERVPAYLRDEDDLWTALSLRARIIAIAKDRVPEGAITRIEDLAKPEWKGRVCTRKGSHVYNRALLASLIAHLGEEKAEAWVEGLVSNLARRPQGNDRAQAKAMFAGECDVAVMNTYYVGKMKYNEKNPEQKKWAAAMGIVYLNQDDRGQHLNISGGGIVKYSKNQDAARAFLEWLTGDEAQRIYTSVNYEFPVNAAVSPDTEVASWGSFKPDTLPISALAENATKAQMVIDRTGW